MDQQEIARRQNLALVIAVVDEGSTGQQDDLREIVRMQSDTGFVSVVPAIIAQRHEVHGDREIVLLEIFRKLQTLHSAAPAPMPCVLLPYYSASCRRIQAADSRRNCKINIV